MYSYQLLEENKLFILTRFNTLDQIKSFKKNQVRFSLNNTKNSFKNKNLDKIPTK